MWGETVSGQSNEEREKPHPPHDQIIHRRHSRCHCATPCIVRRSNDKNKDALQPHGSVSALLLEKCPHSDLKDDVIPGIEEIDYNSNSMLYLFTSSQKLANSLLIHNALMKAKIKETLRLVAVDKAHLYAQHKSTFRGASARLVKYSFNPCSDQVPSTRFFSQ